MLRFHFTPVSHIELDSKISIWSSRVATGREHKSTDRLEPPDHTRHGRRGHDAVLTNHQTAYLRQVSYRGQVSW